MEGSDCREHALGAYCEPPANFICSICPACACAPTICRAQVYSSRIATLESRVLLDSRPQAGLTKELHLLSNDLKRECSARLAAQP